MLKYKELVKWFKDLGFIIFDTNISIDTMKRILNPSDINESEILNLGFFTHVYLQSRFTLVVQLSKVLDENDNQKRNFLKLFNRLSLEKYDEEFKNYLRQNSVEANLSTSKADIKAVISQLRLELDSYKELIHRVKNIRNHVYAHSNSDANVKSVSDIELETLVNLSNKIFNVLYNKIFDAEFLFNETENWKPDYIIRVLSEHRTATLDGIKRSIIEKDTGVS